MAGPGRTLGFYKIIDAPLEVTVQDDGYVDVRSVPPTAQPEELRTTSLLTMAILPDDRARCPADPPGPWQGGEALPHR